MRADLCDKVMYRLDLSNANLAEADLRYAKLERANLMYANLTHADLRCADLSYTNLTDANLTDANLTDANLFRSYLSDVNLECANLSYANLSYANLHSSNLNHANLSGAILYNANLSYAKLFYANLVDADLAGANLSHSNLGGAIECKRGNKMTVKELIIKLLDRPMDDEVMLCYDKEHPDGYGGTCTGYSFNIDDVLGSKIMFTDWRDTKRDLFSRSDEETKNFTVGHWLKEESVHGWDGRSYQCSVCGRSIHLDAAVEDLADYPYCHCGAEMEREEIEK